MFLLVCRMVTIFFLTQRARLGAPFKYLEHVRKSKRKPSRGHWKKKISPKNEFLSEYPNPILSFIWGFLFLGGIFEGIFAIWSISSHTCVQIDWEMVRLIALIGWKLFVTHSIFKDLLKKISHTRFWQSVLGNWSFFSVFKAFVSNFLYYNLYLIKWTIKWISNLL